MTESLGTRVAHGSFWTVGMQLSIRLLGIVSVLILARLLTPEDFGIVAKAAMLHGIFELVTTFGLDSALISNQKASRAHYDTVWTLEVLRGAGIGAILLVSAVPAAALFNEPRLDTVIYCYAAVAVLRGFVNVGIVDFRKSLSFDKDFVFNVLTKVSSFVATITAAILMRDYWAFVVGVATGAAVSVIASFTMSSYRPSLTLAEWRPLFHFSKWMLVSSFAGSISVKLDTLILSRFASTGALGVYTVSYDVSSAPSSELAMPVARAVMPGLAVLNESREQFAAMYVQALSLILCIAIPAACGLSVLANDITEVALGEQWQDAAGLIQILAFVGIGRAIMSLSTAGYISFGRVDVLGKISTIGLVLRGGCLAAGWVLAGVQGVAWGVLASTMLYAACTLLVQGGLGMLSLALLLRRTWRTALAATVMYVLLLEVAAGTGEGWAGALPVLGLLVSVVAGICVFVAGLVGLWVLSGRGDGPEALIVSYLKGRAGAKRVSPA
jgi:O-antigen/teichoic acid export membrane protein